MAGLLTLLEPLLRALFGALVPELFDRLERPNVAKTAGRVDPDRRARLERVMHEARERHRAARRAGPTGTTNEGPCLGSRLIDGSAN